MNIKIHDAAAIEKMRVAGRLAAEVLEMIAEHVKAGVTTLELDNIMLDHIENKQHAISACLGYHGYPKATCISVNEVVCHGIPGIQKLRNGDIVNIDVTVIKDGYYGDTSKMFMVGEPSLRCRQLCKCARESLYKALKIVKPGASFSDIGDVIQPIADKAGFTVVRDYCGHGIGTEFHTDPCVVHYRNNSYRSLIMQPGMIFTIEPMINAGTWKCKVNKKNGWTVTTADKQPSAQYEHTVIVTEDGCEITTRRAEETEIEPVFHNL
ncbi:MAG: type I methionyl aminopeptidase [Succinivibrionaceae bacterium]|nr:type I methionyl aminopeptidase [Succinivibrionaceae bacterium]